MADSKKYDGSQWEHSLRKLTTAAESVENPLYSDGVAITNYTIKGNTVQNGTPTPSNPVDVNGVGERTKNVLPLPASDTIYGVTFDTTGGVVTVNGLSQYSGTLAFNLRVPSDVYGDYYMSGCPIGGSDNSYDMIVYDRTTGARVKRWNGTTNSASDYGEGNVEVKLPQGHTIDVQIRIRSNYDADNVVFSPMIRTPIATSDFEPYGYKIPISNGQQTTNIYLGSTSSTRQIKKLVLDGTENYGASGGNTWLMLGTSVVDFRGTADGAICSHFPLVLRSNFTTNTCAWGSGQIGDLLINIDNKNEEDLKSYIAQQYANGTPVTVWYVLATPETAAVNEPLMKIGDYADTLSNATAIPTTEGANSITVDTTVQPSEFTATWTGWHNATVKEWDGSQWNE